MLTHTRSPPQETSATRSNFIQLNNEKPAYEYKRLYIFPMKQVKIIPPHWASRRSQNHGAATTITATDSR